jgi:adenine-specific DNA-methyltransferase
MNSLLRDYEGKINLIYIDPPFATGADFKMPIKVNGDSVIKEPSGIEIKAYRDTWGQGLASYLQMMYDRLVLMKRLLAENGSIYVHMDWHVGHYVKVILDEIFGRDLFQSEIIFKRTAGHHLSSGMDVMTDTIFYYSKSNIPFYKQVFQQLSEKELEEKFPYIEDETGRRFTHEKLEQSSNAYSRGEIRIIQGKKVVSNLGWRWTQSTFDERLKENPNLIFWTKEGRPRYKRYSDEYEGRKIGNLWDDITLISSNSSEALGYGTQKPEALLKRIIEASCPEGGIVADFFAGSGTTLAVAEKLGRRWIGCDLSKYAIHVTKKRLLDLQGCKPFKILNLGMYQKHKLRENGIKNYIDFILQLYGANSVSGYAYLHGRKGRRLVHIGTPDSFVTESEVKRALEECRSANSSGLDVLGWEFEMGLYELITGIGSEYGVDVQLKQIPIDILDIRERELEGITFFDLNYLDLYSKVEDKKATIAIERFVLANPEYIPDEVRSSLKDFSSYIDYWAVDFDYKGNGDAFHNMRQEYRTREHKNLNTKISHEYDKPGEYDILVKVVDIFGNDTTKKFRVKAG